MIDVNLTGIWKTVKAAVPQLIEQGNGGSIILTSSIAGLVAFPNLAHYTAAKHGVTGLMRTLAVELAPHRIRVNSVHPTTVDTDMVQNKALYELLLGTEQASRADALKVREGGRVVNVHALVATGVNADGHREILGLQVTSGEDCAGWLGFFRDLTARGLTGVTLVTSDAHAGLVAAIGATLPGASWQRCRNPLRGEPAVGDPEEQLAVGAGAAALGL